MNVRQRNDGEQTDIPASGSAKAEPDYSAFGELRERKESLPAALVGLLRQRGSSDLALVGSLAALAWIGGRGAAEIDKPLGCVGVVCIAVLVAGIGVVSLWKGTQRNGTSTKEGSEQPTQSGDGGTSAAEARKSTTQDASG
jgi:hypothetical protein